MCRRVWWFWQIFKKSFALVNQLPYPSTAVCKNKSAECVQPDEYPVGIFQQWLQHTLATERGPRAPLMFYIEARSLYETRRHHREGATTENTQDCFAWGRFCRQLIAFADSRRWMCGVLANDSNSVDWHTAAAKKSQSSHNSSFQGILMTEVFLQLPPFKGVEGLEAAVKVRWSFILALTCSEIIKPIWWARLWRARGRTPGPRWRRCCPPDFAKLSQVASTVPHMKEHQRRKLAPQAILLWLFKHDDSDR